MHSALLYGEEPVCRERRRTSGIALFFLACVLALCQSTSPAHRFVHSIKPVATLPLDGCISLRLWLCVHAGVVRVCYKHNFEFFYKR